MPTPLMKTAQKRQWSSMSGENAQVALRVICTAMVVLKFELIQHLTKHRRCKTLTLLCNDKMHFTYWFKWACYTHQWRTYIKAFPTVIGQHVLEWYTLYRAGGGDTVLHSLLWFTHYQPFIYIQQTSQSSALLCKLLILYRPHFFSQTKDCITLVSICWCSICTHNAGQQHTNKRSFTA